MSHDDNTKNNKIPDEWRELNPLITEAGYALLDRIRQHRHAPRWNEVVGDRIVSEDLEAVDAFREGVRAEMPEAGRGPSPKVVQWVEAMRERSTLFREHIPDGMDLERDWAHVPTMSRTDLAERIVDVTPRDADLDRLIVYDTTGTTGHAVHVPHHPQTLAKSHALCEYALEQYGVLPRFGPDMVACFNVCAQVNTYVFPIVFSAWNQAGFAKVNLHPKDWAGGRESARRYFEDLAPHFVTADPVAIAEMLRWDVPTGPKAIFSTAVELSPGLKTRAEERFGCAVIDWYSSTETGPIAFTAPDGDGLQIASPDIYVEAVDEDGYPVGPGETGELTVTGGRNPYVPLLRYRTGDFGRVEDGRIHDLHGRKVVFFRATDGSVVNPVDIGRIMRLHCAFAQHQFVQQDDGSCTVRVRPVPGLPVDTDGLARKLATLFGESAKIDVIVDKTLGDGMPGGKVEPYIQLSSV